MHSLMQIPYVEDVVIGTKSMTDAQLFDQANDWVKHQVQPCCCL